MPNRKPVSIFILCMLILLGGNSAAECWFDQREVIPLNAPLTLELDVKQGEIIITSGDNDNLIIEAVKRIRGKNWDKARKIAEKIEIDIQKVGNHVRIATEYLPLDGKDRSWLGKLFGAEEHAFGDIDFHITVPEMSYLRIESVAGKIELSSLESRIDIQNKRGSIQAEFISGPITVRQEVGPIDLQWVEGDIRIKSEVGRIWIKQIQGALDLATIKGYVSVQTELNSPRDYFVQTRSGQVEFLVPQRSSGQLTIETHKGVISTEVPITIKSATKTSLQGEFGVGGPKIEISSVSGDVTVASF